MGFTWAPVEFAEEGALLPRCVRTIRGRCSTTGALLGRLAEPEQLPPNPGGPGGEDCSPGEAANPKGG